MSEKKEKQYVVCRDDLNKPNGFPIPQVWFDARQDARAYAAAQNTKSKRFNYRVFPITRGPNA